MKLPENLPDVLHVADGDVRVKGSRISLYHVINAYNVNWVGAEAMVFYYPTLSLHQIEAVLAYYHANEDDVDEYVRACDAHAEEMMAKYATRGPTREELLARLPEAERERFLRKRPLAPRPADVPRPEAG